MHILYNNLYLTATIDYSTQNPNYPIGNTQDTRLSRVFRTIDATDEYIKISTSITASRVAIMGHNFVSDTVVHIQGNNTDVWTPPSLDQALTIVDGVIVGSFTEATYAYWRITMTGGTGLTYFQIGACFLGTFLQLPGMKADQSIDDETTSVSTESASGQSYGDIGYDFRAPAINFPFVSDAQRATVRTIWETVHNVKPIIAVIWSERTDMETAIYCIIDQNKISWKRTTSVLLPWSFTLKIKEVF